MNEGGMGRSMYLSHFPRPTSKLSPICRRRIDALQCQHTTYSSNKYLHTKLMPPPPLFSSFFTFFRLFFCEDVFFYKNKEKEMKSY